MAYNYGPYFPSAFVLGSQQIFRHHVAQRHVSHLPNRVHPPVAIWSYVPLLPVSITPPSSSHPFLLSFRQPNSYCQNRHSITSPTQQR